MLVYQLASEGYLNHSGIRNMTVRSLRKWNCMLPNRGMNWLRNKHLYFRTGGGDMITLRPELTPSLARMIAQKQE